MSDDNERDPIDAQLQDSLEVPTTEAEVPDRVQVVRVPELEQSFSLQLLLSFLYNSENNVIPLTVTTSGGVYFGNAVHPAAFYRAMAAQVRTQPSTTGDNVAVIFDTLAKDASDRFADAGQDDISEIGFIYFTDAMVLAPRATGQLAYSEPAAWQVNLQHVVGWTVGPPPVG